MLKRTNISQKYPIIDFKTWGIKVKEKVKERLTRGVIFMFLYFSFVGLPILLSSCNTAQTAGKQLNCNALEQNCFQTQYVGEGIDTSRVLTNKKGYYYKIQPLLNINSKEDEFSISAFGGNLGNKESGYAALTYNYNKDVSNGGDNNRNTKKVQRIRKVHFISPSNVEFEGERISLSQENYHLGFPSLSISKTNESFVSYSTSYFPSENDNQLSLDKIIGVSQINTLKLTPTLNTYDKILEKIKKSVSQLPNSAELVVDSKNFYRDYNNKDTFDINLFVSHPAWHPNEKVLFFSANYYDWSHNNRLQESYKGNDIFFVIKEGDKFSKPINCGRIVNSDCDEISPFITSDGGMLLYSSLGFNSVGGYDIFQVMINQEVLNKIINEYEKTGFIDLTQIQYLFLEQKNIGFPANTKADEIFPTCPGDCDSVLYYSSNQNIGNGFDIYVKEKIYVNKQDLPQSKAIVEEWSLQTKDIVAQTPTLPEITLPEEKKVIVEGRVFAEKTGTPIQGANVNSRYKKTAGKISETITDSDGVYKLEIPKGKEVEITAQAEGVFFDKFDVSVDLNGNTQKINMDFKLVEKMTLRINFPYDEYKEPYPFMLDSNGNVTNETWQSVIDNLAQDILNSGKNLKYVEIVGHTDQIASSQYNNILGKNRADFVATELVKRGVDNKLLKVYTKGKSEALPRRQDEDLETYHKRLRRVTFEKKF